MPVTPSLSYLSSLPAGRILLILNGLALTSTGISYIRGTDRKSLQSLDKLFGDKAKFEGGINLIAPFAGCAYLSTSILNIVAALSFQPFECKAVMISTGLLFHAGMAGVRTLGEHWTRSGVRSGWVTSIGERSNECRLINN